MSRTTRSLVQLTLFHFRSLYRNKIALFFNLIFPLIMIAIFGGLYGTQTSDVEVAASGTAGAGEVAVRPMNAFDYLIPGQMAVMLLSAGFITVGINIAAQRNGGTLRHLFSTPISIGGWAVTRALSNLVMSIIQGALLYAFAALLFDVAPPANLLGTLVVVFVSALTCLSMGLLVGVLVKGEAGAMAVSMPFFSVLIFLGNSAMPLIDPPRIISLLLPWMPTYHMTNAMREVMRFGSGLSSVLPELAILGGIAVVFWGVSLWLLRRQFVVR